jgi:hypothetical protein
MTAQIVIDPAAFDFPAFPSKAARTGWFKSLLCVDARWAAWALATIYARQTADEQSAGVTVHDNAVGFSGKDSEFLSSLAAQLQKKGTLSPKQWAALHKLIPAYGGQCLDVLDDSGVVTVIDKAAPVPAAPAAFAVESAAPALKPGEPDWSVWRAIVKGAWLSPGWRATVEQYIGKCDQFAKDVWATINAKGGASEKQVKVIATQCAKAANPAV